MKTSRKEIVQYPRARDFVFLCLQTDQTGQQVRTLKKEAKVLYKKPAIRKLLYEGEWEGLRVIDYAASGGHHLLFDILVTYLHMDPKIPDEDSNRSPLHHAAQAGQDTMVRNMIANHACPVEATDCCGSTPLNMAISNGKNSTMDILLEYGASAQVKNFFGLPIHCAALQGNDYAVQKLYGFNHDMVNAVEFGFCTPIGAAVCGGSLSCTCFLAQVTDATEIPLLYNAVACMSSEKKALEFVNVLLGIGVNANLLNEVLLEEPAIVLAAKRGWRGIVEALLNHTDPIQGVNWSADDLIAHFNTADFKEMEKEKRKIRVDRLKDMIIQELKDGHYLSAEMIHSALRFDMDEEKWNDFRCLCAFMRYHADASICLPCDVGDIVSQGWVMYDQNWDDLAVMGARACMALDPKNEYCVQLMQSVIEKFGSIIPATSGNRT